MAQGEYTLAINSGLPQDISALTVANYPTSTPFTEPDIFGGAAATTWTPAQIPLLQGAKRDRLVWSVVAILEEADALKLGALYQWQQNRYLNQLDGRLTWTDEVFYHDPQATPIRTFVANLTSADGQTYGYPIVDCLISKPKKEIWQKGNPLTYQVTFQVEEVRVAS
ncbi:MAG: hypothetical protein AAFN18_21130 [Cyanobacteria bacterium J06554_6]